MRRSPSEARSSVWLAFVAIYLIWGSTYLAIRYAIETLPTFSTGGIRYVIAGGALYGWARWRGRPRATLREWGWASLTGAFLFLAGNGGVVWAEHRVPSGIAALLIATEPLWIAVLVPAFSAGRRPGPRAFLGIAAGLAGVLVLVGRGAGLAGAVDTWGAVAVVGAAAAWAIGSLISIRARLPKDPAASTGLQMLAGGVWLSLAAVANGEIGAFDPAGVSWRSVVALGYLTVAGSIIAFSAYTYLLREVRPTVVSTYAFVNPIVAVILGWLVAGEPLDGRVALAGGLILVAVAAILLDPGERGTRRERPARSAGERPEESIEPRPSADPAVEPGVRGWSSGRRPPSSPPGSARRAARSMDRDRPRARWGADGATDRVDDR
jgi:drug/metabolite transporter (DMT)-like permease